MYLVVGVVFQDFGIYLKPSHSLEGERGGSIHELIHVIRTRLVH